MGLPEGQVDLAHQPVGQVGGHAVIGRGNGAHALGIGLEVAHHAGHRRHAQLQRIGGVEQRLLVLLHVLAIGQRQALQHGAEGHERSHDAAGLAACQLGGVGIALLRHDRAAGGEGIRQRDEAERRRAPDHDLFRQARQMDGGHRGRGNEFHDVVAVRHGIERVQHWPIEAQRLGRPVPVDRMRRAGQCGGAQRRFVEALAAIGEARAVAAEHLDIGHEVMAEGDRLRRLQMGEARHDGRGIFLGPVDQGCLQVLQHGLDAVDGVAHPEAHVERHLVVARARRVQPPAGRADQVGQALLDVEMDVFQLGRKDEFAALDLGLDLGQPGLDRLAVPGSQDLLRHQHLGMGDRPRDVLGIEPAVETDGGVDLLHDLGRAELVAAAPHAVAGGLGGPRVRSRLRVLSCHE